MISDIIHFMSTNTLLGVLIQVSGEPLSSFVTFGGETGMYNLIHMMKRYLGFVQLGVSYHGKLKVIHVIGKQEVMESILTK